MIVALLILHGVLAVLLLGGLTHQCIALWGSREKSRGAGFVAGARGVRPWLYATPVVWLYVATVVVGGIIYPEFRVTVRTVFDRELPAATGGFEIKEHFTAIGFGLLPVYWYFWNLFSQSELDDKERVFNAVRIVTLLLTFIAWVAFLVGHILNNIEGL